MERAITGFHSDPEGDWVAELDCGHNQHVRHCPPLQWREWVLQPTTRNARIGTPIDCPLCDRTELPETVRSSDTKAWDDNTLPVRLQRAHRLDTGTWGRLIVHRGRLRFRAATTPPIDTHLVAGSTRSIPPGVDHQIEPIGSVAFALETLTVKRGEGATNQEIDVEPTEAEQETATIGGGDPACWAHLICPECGRVARDDSGHRPGCTAGSPPTA